MKINRLLLCALLIGLLSMGILTGCSCDDDDDDNDDNDAADDDETDDDDDNDTGDDDDDDDDTTDDDTTDDDTGDDDTTDDDTGDDDTDVAPTEPISVRLKDFITALPVANATCEIVRNSNGGSFNPPITTTSDSDGYCLFNQPPKKEFFSMKVTKTGLVDSYFFNYSTDYEWYFYTVSNITRTLIFSILGLTQDETKGAVVGGVKWQPNSGTSQDVGCAEVSSTGGDTVYYMDDSGLPTASRTSTNPEDGYFLALLVDPGSYTFTADTDGNEESEPAPRVFANSLTYINITYHESEYPTNPEPAGCTK